jgi:hypothetical protein
MEPLGSHGREALILLGSGVVGMLLLTLAAVGMLLLTLAAEAWRKLTAHDAAKLAAGIDDTEGTARVSTRLFSEVPAAELSECTCDWSRILVDETVILDESCPWHGHYLRGS